MPRARTIECACLVFLLAHGTAAGANAKVDQPTRYLERSVSQNGPTGWINIPSAAVAGSGELTAGIHRGRGKLNLGLFGIFEGGLAFSLDQFGVIMDRYQDLSAWDKFRSNVCGFSREAFLGQAKLKLLDQDWAGLSLAGGLEAQDTYVVAQRFFPELSRVTLLAGWGNGRFAQGFGGFSKTILPGAELSFEYDGRDFHTGLRMLLAKNLVLNVAIAKANSVGEVQNLGEVIGDHLLFGVTYVERLW